LDRRRVPQFQISGGPSWVSSDRYDVECKAEDREADNNQLRLMLQSMLGERFRLKIYREPGDGPNHGGILLGSSPPAAPSSSDAPSIFAAIQEQLGLKLESAKGPVE
jgi:hypothetical protein